MRVRIWGCRGSLASPGAETVRYGGNTSCVGVETDDGTLIILDAGTGLRRLGMQLIEEPSRPIHILLSHLHLDHLEGLGFFPPLFRAGVELHIWGPPSPTVSLGDRIARYLSPPLFPLHLSEVSSKPQLHDVEPEWTIGGARVRAHPVSHQGPTVGYRIDNGSGSLAYIPDHEPSRAGDINDLDPSWVSGHAVAHRADLLIHDSQYTEEEYPARIGWGHSSTRHVTDFARIAGVGRLLLFHHDPLHTDTILDAKLARARELIDGALQVDNAYEGMEIALR